MTSMESSIGYKPESLWSSVSKLIHLRQVTMVSGFKRAKTLVKVLDIGLVLLALGVGVGAYLLTKAILNELNSPVVVESGINLPALMDAVPSTVIAMAFILIMMTSFRVLLQALYLAKDMDFLVSAPIPMRAVFLSKLLEAILPNFILVLILGLPVLLSLGVSRGYNLVYYPLLLVVLWILSLAAAGISGLLVMVVVRIVPAKRVAEVITFLGALMIILVSQSFNLMSHKLENLSAGQIASGADLISKLNNPWLPLVWGGRSLVNFGLGNWQTGLIFLTLTLVLSGAVFWFALQTAERLYYTGWASLKVGTQRRKNQHEIRRSLDKPVKVSIMGRFLPIQVWAIMVKDFRQIRRDLTNLSQVIGSVITGIVLGVMLLRSGGGPEIGQGNAPDMITSLLRSGVAYGSMVIGVFVGWTFIARLALVAFSMEGRSYWILKTAPVSAGNLLAAKFLMAYLPSLVLSLIYLIAIAILQHSRLITVLYGIPSIALILAGLCGINLAFGVRGVNLNWTDPRKMENNIAGLTGTIISILYQLITLVLFFGPPLGFPLLGLSERLGMLVGLLAGAAVTLLSTFLPLKMIKSRVSRIGEE